MINYAINIFTSGRILFLLSGLSGFLFNYYIDYLNKFCK